MDTLNLFTNTVNNLAASGGGSSNITHIVTVLLIQIGIILIAAKLAGYVASRFLKIPSVLAEIGIGILIGPFALGAFPLPFFGPIARNIRTWSITSL